MSLRIPIAVGGTVAFTPPPQAPAPVAKKQTLVIPEGVGPNAPRIVRESLPAQPGTAPAEQEEPGFFGGIASRAKAIGGVVAGAVSGADRQTPETQSLPELGGGGLLDGEDSLKAHKVTAAIMLTPNTEEIGKILTSNFPNITITQDEKGNSFALNSKTGKKVVLNKPGISKLDIIQGLSTVAAFVPAGRIATVGTAAAKAGAGLLTKQTGKLIGRRAAQGGAASGATEAAIQTGQAALGGDFDAGQVAAATALGGVAEAVVPGIQSIRAGKRSVKIGAQGQSVDDVAENVARSRRASEETGIPLFQAQQTNVPAQLEKQSFLPSLPAATQKASRELGKQNQAALDAVETVLKKIAPAEAVTVAPGRFRTAAQRALEKQKNIRAEKSSPIYKEAFKAKESVDVSTLKTQIKDTLEDFPKGGEVFKSLARVSSFLKDKPSIRKLHNAKLEIDQMINKVGSDSLGNTTKAKLVEAKNNLLSIMDNASPEYARAREVFRNNSPVVTQLEDSIIGKVAAFDDTQLKTISRRIFDPAETNVSTIRNAKKIIDDVDPDAWNLLLRSEMERRIGSVSGTLEAASLENIPGQLNRAIFGNTKSRAVLKAGVEGDAAKNMSYLSQALTRASRGRATGSQTATREEIKKELRGGVFSAVGNLLSPISSTRDFFKNFTFDGRAKIMANVLFDPQWKTQMKKLRQLSPNSPASARALTQLFKDASKQVEEDQQ